MIERFTAISETIARCLLGAWSQQRL